MNALPDGNGNFIKCIEVSFNVGNELYCIALTT